MKQLTVAIVVIGAFVLYSLLHVQSSAALPGTSTTAGFGNPPTPVATVSGANPNGTTGPTPAPTVIAQTTQAPSPTPTTAPAPTTQPTTQPTATATTAVVSTSGTYKDGTYTGPSMNAQWGNIQVQATIAGGKLTDVQFIDYPHDRSRSVYINQIADPRLRSEAIQGQTSQVDVITGATDSSRAFIRSLSLALSQAKA